MSRLHREINRKAWERVRLYILRRDDYRCADCGGPGFEVDHVEPLHWGGAALDPDNLAVRCRGCHIAKTRKENQRRGPEALAWRALVRELK